MRSTNCIATRDPYLLVLFAIEVHADQLRILSSLSTSLDTTSLSNWVSRAETACYFRVNQQLFMVKTCQNQERIINSWITHVAGYSCFIPGNRP